MNPKALSETAVWNILTAIKKGESLSTVAKRSGTSRSTVSAVLRGSCYRNYCPKLPRKINGEWVMLPSTDPTVSKLIIDDRLVRKLIGMIQADSTIRQAAEECGISAKQAEGIIRGQTWTHLALDVPRRIKGQWVSIDDSANKQIMRAGEAPRMTLESLAHQQARADVQHRPKPAPISAHRESSRHQGSLLLGVFAPCGRIGHARHDVNLSQEQRQRLLCKGFSVMTLYQEEIKDHKPMCDACKLRSRCLFPDPKAVSAILAGR